MLILTPSPTIYRREPPAIHPGIEPNRHGGPTTLFHMCSKRRWGLWVAATWPADHHGQLAVGWARSAPFLVWRLLGESSCHVWGAWLVLRRFGCSGGLVDPRERVWFIEKVLPQIDNVSPCLWAAFLPIWGCLVGHLILVRSWAFIPWVILASFLCFWPKFTCTHYQTSICGICQ